MTRRAVWLAATVVVAAACAGAGHEHGADGGGVQAAAADTAALVVGQATIDLPRSYLFRPETLVVRPGTRVTWTNHDVFTHGANVEGVGATAPIRPGASASLVLERPGTYAYDCPFHPQNMKGVLVVRAD